MFFLVSKPLCFVWACSRAHHLGNCTEILRFNHPRLYNQNTGARADGTQKVKGWIWVKRLRTLYHQSVLHTCPSTLEIGNHRVNLHLRMGVPELYWYLEQVPSPPHDK